MTASTQTTCKDRTLKYSVNQDNVAAVNQQFLSTILAAQRAGLGCLPDSLGLDGNEFETLISQRFSHLRGMISPPENGERNAILMELLALRETEQQDLMGLLEQHAAGFDSSEKWLTKIVATACLGSDHLWRDLGLADRRCLKRLFECNFPTLAEKNTGDMRWKKFLYRQLCEQGGHFVCRSPSCETCPTYEECFGEEV